MNNERPMLDELFQRNGEWFRISAIGPRVIVGTLNSVVGTPTCHKQITTLSPQQFADLQTIDIFGQAALVYGETA